MKIVLIKKLINKKIYKKIKYNYKNLRMKNKISKINKVSNQKIKIKKNYKISIQFNN